MDADQHRVRRLLDHCHPVMNVGDFFLRNCLPLRIDGDVLGTDHFCLNAEEMQQIVQALRNFQIQRAFPNAGDGNRAAVLTAVPRINDDNRC